MSRVLYVCATGHFGGAERFVLNALKGHESYSAHKASLLLFNSGEFCGTCKKYKINFSVLKNKFKLTRPFKLLMALYEIRAFLKKNKIEIVQSTMPYAHIVMSLASWGLNVKHIWFQHGPVGGLLDKIANLFPVDKVFFNSTFLQDQHNKMVCAKRKIKNQFVIPLGIEIKDISQSERDSLRSKYTTESVDCLIGIAGRICSWKGHHLLIQSYLKLDASIKNRNKVLIIGEAKRENDLLYKKELEELVEQNGLTENIIFVGHCENIELYIKACDLLVHASTTPEPFGLVIGEAMALKTPVIGSSVGGVRDILKDRETGRSFNPCAETAIDDLEKLIENHFEKQEESLVLKEAAFDLISRSYSIEKMMNEINKLYSAD